MSSTLDRCKHASKVSDSEFTTIVLSHLSACRNQCQQDFFIFSLSLLLTAAAVKQSADYYYVQYMQSIACDLRT